MPRHLRLLSVVVAVAANAVLFYVLALARVVPSPLADADYDIMRVTPINLPAVSEFEEEIVEPAAKVSRPIPEVMLAVSVEPAIDTPPSLLPRLLDLMGNISPDLTGLAVVLPGLSEVRSADSASVPGLGEHLSVLKVDRIPLKISGAMPRYPQWARRAGLEAVVTLRFVVTVEGTVRDIRIHHIEGDERFGDEAIKAVAAWLFDPAIKGGNPVACWCFQKVNFKLVR
jgi:TonB family protein